MLALALAVRALRNGSVCIDLSTVSTTVFDESEAGIDLPSCPGPSRRSWPAACAASGLVADGADQPGRPAAAAGQRPALPGALLAAGGAGPRAAAATASPHRRRTSTGPGLRRRCDRLFPGDGLGDRRARPATARRRGQRPRLGDGARRRPGHRQDHHRRPAAGPAARPARPAAADRPGRADRQGRGPARGGDPGGRGEAAAAGPERIWRRERVDPAPAAGLAPGPAAAGSCTTPATSCRTTWWWSTRCRWSR